MPPSILYHYTDSRGLKGMLETHSLWATNVNFLNDETEIRYARSVLDKVLVDTMAELPDEDAAEDLSAKRALAVFAGLPDPFADMQLFVSCFCAEGDLLSMWRGYGAGGGGYSIGFAPEPLNARALIYSREEQETEIAKFAKTFIEDWDKARGVNEADPDKKREVLAKPLTDLARSAYVAMIDFKDAAFSEEKEWRSLSVLKEYPDGLDQIHYRLGRSGFVPYLAITNIGGQQKLPIKEVVYGPSMHPTLTETGLRIALDKNGYQAVTVKRSKVPLRVMSPSSAMD